MADLAIPPLKIVGYEGVLGAATMLLLVLPVVQRLPGADGQGLHEDSVDTWHVRRGGGCVRRVERAVQLRGCVPVGKRAQHGWQVAVVAGDSRLSDQTWVGCSRPQCCTAPTHSRPPGRPPQMITHSRVIAGVLVVDATALLMYNVSGMCVTGHLGAVFR